MPPTTNYSPGDVVLVRVNFTDQAGSKVRPAVVISPSAYHAARQELIIAPITSQGTVYHADVRLQDWAAAGLIKPSIAKGVLQTVTASIVQRSLGKLSGSDHNEVRANIPRLVES